MTIEQKKYLKSLKKHKLAIVFGQIILLFFLIFLWQILADKKIINEFITSSPQNIIKTINKLYSNKDLFIHINTTIYETIISFTLSFIIGFFIASILWFKKNIAQILEPYFTILNSLPKVALGPVILVWCGANIKSIILMAILVSIVITIINIYQGFISVDQNRIKLMKTFRANKIQIFLMLVVPHSLKNILSTLKISISMSLIGLLPPVGEKIFFNKCYSRY